MAETAPIRLLEPVLDPQDRNPHFFNGRILTAADLRDARDAQRRYVGQLGRALGAGIVSGFEVGIDFAGAAGDPPRLTVFGGLAVNACGDLLQLARQSLVLSLGEALTSPSASAGLFGDCDQTTPASAAAAGSLSILAVTPASGFGPEKAPLRGQPGDGASTGCGLRYALAGVAFREIALPAAAAGSFGALTPAIGLLLNATSPSTGDKSTLRNLLAQACFGLVEPAAADNPLARLPDQPARADDGHGLLDRLRAADDLDITACDVPLALVYRWRGGLGFLDMWSVRRRLNTPFAGEPWPGLLADRRGAETEAALLQFQDQLETLRVPPINPANVEAKSYFRFLPAAGVLPVGTGGFSPTAFFRNLTVRAEEEVDPAFLRLLFDQSRHLDPVDLNGTTAFRLLRPRGINTYRVFVREEWHPVVAAAPTTPTGESKPTTGSLRIVLRLDAKATAALLKEYKFTAGETQLPANALTLEIRDSANRHYTPVRNQNKGVDGLSGKGAPDFANGRAEFFCDNLSPDTYTVTVKGKVIATASQSKAVRAGDETTFEFVLTARKVSTGGVKPGERPSRDTPGEWIKDWPLERLWMMDRFVAWPWPPEPNWDKRPWVTDPSPEDFGDWLVDWAEVLQTEYPDAPIDAGRAHVVFDPAYVPGTTTEDPYAYVVFGDSGAYAPLVATTPDHSLAGAVGTARAGVPGIDAEAASRLAAKGFDRVDILAHAWTNGVADALEANVAIANTLIDSAALRTDALKGSSTQIPGIDANAAKALDAAGFGLSEMAGAEAAGRLHEMAQVLETVGYDTNAATAYANAYAKSATALNKVRM